MTHTVIIDPLEAELFERIKLLLFGVNLPVQRLEADVDDIGRFTAPDARSPQLRLVKAMPPLTPAAEAIVRAMIRSYGTELFQGGGANAALLAMIKAGPIIRTDCLDIGARRADAGACATAHRRVQPRF